MIAVSTVHCHKIYQMDMWRHTLSHFVFIKRTTFPPGLSATTTTTTTSHGIWYVKAHAAFKPFLSHFRCINLFTAQMERYISAVLTLWSVLCYYGNCLSCVLQSCSCLLMCCTGQVHSVHLHTHTQKIRGHTRS